MSTKQDILSKVTKNIGKKYDMPNIDIKGIQYPDLLAQFIEISKGVGGNAVELKAGQDINELIRSIHPDAKVIASNLPEITIATISPDKVDDPRELNGTDVGVIQGEVGVAENGCVWIPRNVKEKAVFFISEYLIILLDKKNLVHNMHEAYDKIDFHGQNFGVFISGPSKTADIEQALVVGAHGARGVTVVLV